MQLARAVLLARGMAVAARHDLPSVVYELEPGAASRPLPGAYRRREPEKTALHWVVRENLETLLEEARGRSEGGYEYPGFVEKEFRRYLDCGLLPHGLPSPRLRRASFARLRCPTCGFERLAAFLRTVFAWQRLRGRRLGIRGETGSVTFTQRF